MRGQVLSLHRYPVKSLLGERLDRVVVDERGVAADRLWSVRDPDGRIGSGKTTRRFRRMDGLLELAASYDGDVPAITFPSGKVVRGDDPEIHGALSRHVGRPVRLAREEEVSHFDDGPLHLVTTASLDALGRAHGSPVDARRTRANVVVHWNGSGSPELSWPGHLLHVGPELVLRVRDVMPRCVMLNAAQDELPRDGTLLTTVMDVSAGALGVVAEVEKAGRVAVGDEVRLSTG